MRGYDWNIYVVVVKTVDKFVPSASSVANQITNLVHVLRHDGERGEITNIDTTNYSVFKSCFKSKQYSSCLFQQFLRVLYCCIFTLQQLLPFFSFHKNIYWLDYFYHCKLTVKKNKYKKLFPLVSRRIFLFFYNKFTVETLLQRYQ